jgi:hypothetical protein
MLFGRGAYSTTLRALYGFRIFGNSIKKGEDEPPLDGRV